MIDNYEHHIDGFNEIIEFVGTNLDPECQFYYVEGHKSEMESCNGDSWLSNKDDSHITTDSILFHIGWNQTDLNELKTIIKKTDCIGINIKSRNEIELLYRQRGTGIYSYLLYPYGVSLDELDSTIHRCDLVHVSNEIVLKFSAGATGNICFPKCDRPHAFE